MKELNDPIRSYQTRMYDLAKLAEELRPILKACEDAVARSEISANPLVGVRDPLKPKVELVVMANQLKEVVGLLRELAKEGLHVEKDEAPKDTNIFDFAAMRTYKLGSTVEVSVMIIGNDGEGPVCKAKQVGVKEVPIYEIECE